MNHSYPIPQEDLETLMAYADGQLPTAESERFAVHLATCAECGKELANARNLSKHMSDWQVEEAPDGMTSSVNAALDSLRPQTPRSFLAWLRQRPGFALRFSAVCGVCVLVVASVVLYQHSQMVLPFNEGSAGLAAPISAFEKMPVTTSPAGQAQGQGQQGQQGQGTLGRATADTALGPQIIRTIQLSLVTKQFETARARLEAIVRNANGYMDHLNVNSDPGSPRTLSAELRLPSARIDAGLAELRQLGQVTSESQGSTEVSSQVVDLAARLTNSRNTEQRLLALLRQRTGKLEEVVAAEREVSRVREEIERMEAQQKDLNNKIQYGSIQIALSEEYHATARPGNPPAGTQVRNAAVDGMQFAWAAVLGLLLGIVRFGPALLVWLSVLSSLTFLVWKICFTRIWGQTRNPRV